VNDGFRINVAILDMSPAPFWYARQWNNKKPRLIRQFYRAQSGEMAIKSISSADCHVFLEDL
jgi:hypothetical protein